MTDPAELEDGDIFALADVGDDNRPHAAFPMGECEGDCDSDYDCEVSSDPHRCLLIPIFAHFDPDHQQLPRPSLPSGRISVLQAR